MVLLHYACTILIWSSKRQKKNFESIIKKVRTKSLLMCLRPCICVNTDPKVNNNIIWTINFFLHSETNLIPNSSVANLKISTKQIDLGSLFMSKNQIRKWIFSIVLGSWNQLPITTIITNSDFPFFMSFNDILVGVYEISTI